MDAENSYRIAIAQNVSTNGRLFCVMLFALAVVMFIVTRDIDFARIALLATLPVGLSCVGDRAIGAARGLISLIVYLLAAVLAVGLFVQIG